MRKFLLTLAVLIGVLMPTVAYADEHTPEIPIRLTVTTDICVASDFPLVGSHHRPRAAIRNWNAAFAANGLPMFMRFTSLTEALSCPTSVVLHRFNSLDLPDTHFAKGWCAYTTWDTRPSDWVVSDTINTFNKADIYLNDQCMTPKRIIDGLEFPASTHYTKPGNKAMIAHELGHALGLPHNETGSLTAVMAYSYDVRTYRGVIGADDIANLTALYSIVPEAIPTTS